MIEADLIRTLIDSCKHGKSISAGFLQEDIKINEKNTSFTGEYVIKAKIGLDKESNE
jgi:hypothetical protein